MLFLGAQPAIRLSALFVCALLAFALPAAAEEPESFLPESFLLEGEDRRGQAIESRVTLTTRADGSLWIERVVRGPEGTQRRVGQAIEQVVGDERRLLVEFPRRQGVVGSLGGQSSSGQTSATDALRVQYRLSAQGVLAQARLGGVVLSRERGRRLASPAPVSSYSAAALGGSIDVAGINAGASALLRSLTDAERSVRFPVIVVPGFASEDQGDTRLHERTKKRAQRAVKLLRAKGAHVILCSGANVHPTGTPFNEAVELRRYLVEELGVAPWRVAIEPRARHTTTNMRNAGRFLLTHGLERALVVTSRGQSFYLSAPRISSFHRRCRATLGYEVGRFSVRSHWTTLFKPSQRVFRPGPDPLDP